MNLSEIAARRLKVERRGRIHWALCPFHPDKHPSLAIYDGEDAHYHCFSCGEHGDAIDWLIKIEKLSYPEAKKMAGSEATGQYLGRKHGSANAKRHLQSSYTISWPARGVQHQEVALLRERLVTSRWSDGLTMFKLSVSSPVLTDEQIRLRHPYASDFTISRLREIYGKPKDESSD